MITSITEFKKYLQTNEGHNETDLEDAVTTVLAGYVNPEIGYMSGYNLDEDGHTIILYVDAEHVLFNVADANAPQWKELQIKFEDYCNKNGLFNPQVTCTSDHTQLVLSADTDASGDDPYDRY